MASARLAAIPFSPGCGSLRVAAGRDGLLKPSGRLLAGAKHRLLSLRRLRALFRAALLPAAAAERPVSNARRALAAYAALFCACDAFARRRLACNLLLGLCGTAYSLAHAGRRTLDSSGAALYSSSAHLSLYACQAFDSMFLRTCPAGFDLNTTLLGYLFLAAPPSWHFAGAYRLTAGFAAGRAALRISFRERDFAYALWVTLLLKRLYRSSIRYIRLTHQISLTFGGT